MEAFWKINSLSYEVLSLGVGNNVIVLKHNIEEKKYSCDSTKNLKRIPSFQVLDMIYIFIVYI